MYYNQNISVTTISKNQTYYSSSGNIFLNSNFDKTASLSWTHDNKINMTNS